MELVGPIVSPCFYPHEHAGVTALKGRQKGLDKCLKIPINAFNC